MPNLADLKSEALQLVTNMLGWRTHRKLLIIESDDWGAIRMPSQQAWERLLAAGIRVDRSPYDMFDCLERRDDLQALFQIIDSQRDSHGQPAIFTFNTVMGNPDFEAIERDDFQNYYHQHMFDSYRQYCGQDLEPDWRMAIKEKLIRPQFHALEHINVPLWMRDLKSGHKEARIAFSERFYGLTTNTSSARQRNYLAAFWTESPSELESAQRRFQEGISVFRETFGFSPTTFVPCNYVLPHQLEPLLCKEGIWLIQGQRGQYVPDPFGGKGCILRTYTGKRTSGALLRSVRNVMFEPFESRTSDPVNTALRQISQSFALKRPAILSSHRANYSSHLKLSHRDRSLKMLDSLLTQVRKRWPEVEFMTSDGLLSEVLAN